MAGSFKGGCSCGAVRYECAADPVFTANCHCRDCQRASGGGFVSVVGVPRDAVKITGEVKYFDVTGDSGNPISRGFCPNCGSRLFAKPAAAPAMMGIMAGSLDDSGWYRPAMNIYTSSAQPWAHMDPALPKFPKMPQP
ncbi:MAG TPA: GFA family protein [Candidatus Binataceae bacterium]|nr:GFA family protein [Candidatus Binataceae bacterium]